MVIIINDTILFSGQQPIKNTENELVNARDIKVGDIILFQGRQIAVKSIKKRSSLNIVEK